MNAKELREARERLGMTQVELADALDVQQATISRWETGEHAIEKPTMLRLAIEALRLKKKRRR